MIRRLKQPTQTDMILNFLKRYGSITPIEALQEFGCMRLSARIKDLENRGYVVPRKWVKKQGRKTGRTVRFMKYYCPKA